MGGLLKLADFIDAFNRRFARVLSFLVLALIIVQFALVVMSENFHVGSIKLQESLLYLNALLFLGAAGFTLLRDEHVRIDIFYRAKSGRGKTLTDLVGHLILLMPFMIFLWLIGVPYVVESWVNQEASFETSGLQIVYILKTFLLVFAVTLTLQGISGIIRCIDKLKDKG